MDKNIIKNHLSKRFLSEESTPGITVTDKAKKESEKINKAGVKDMEKDSLDYNKSLKQDKDTSKMPPNKFNYNNDFEKTYHEEMEILNGQEMVQYDRIPNEEFAEKAKEGIEGSSRMGNKGGKGIGNAEEIWNASSDDFGKKLVKRIKNSAEKRAQETPAISLRGKDIQDLPSKKNDNGHKPIAVEENNNNNNSQIKESMKRLKFNINGDKPFKGVNLTQKLGHALTLIPEGYKVDSKEFEMTDGNVTCRVRWEGTLNEGKGIIIQAADKTLINEDMNRMKALMGYKSEETLGLVKGNARLNENKVFGDIWNKSKKLLGESEDIEDADVVEGSAESLDDAVDYAAEAKKHVEGSVSTDDGTQAPAPKKGEWEKINVKHAPEAKKHVEGSVAEEKKTSPNTSEPKEGHWEEIKKKSTDASKDVESGKPTNMATDKPKTVAPAKAVNENFGEEEEEEEESEETTSSDDFLKPDTDDDSMDTEKEPTAKDIKNDVPSLDNDDNDEDDITPKVPMVPKGGVSATILFSPSTGEYWLKKGEASTKVPDEYLSIAADKAKKGAERAAIILKAMQDKVDSGEEGEEELDEYGDEHPISTADAVAGMKPGAVKEYGDEHPISTKDAVNKMKIGK